MVKVIHTLREAHNNRQTLRLPIRQVFDQNCQGEYVNPNPDLGIFVGGVTLGLALLIQSFEENKDITEWVKFCSIQFSRTGKVDPTLEAPVQDS